MGYYGPYIYKKPVLRALAWVVDLVGGVLIPRRSRPKIQGPQKFLVIRLDHIGDIVSMLYVPAALKMAFPESEVHVLTSSAGEELFKNNPWVDSVTVWNAPWYSRGANKSAVSFSSLVETIHALGPTCALSLRGDIRENYALWAAGIRRRVGFGITGGGFLLTDRVKYRVGAHESDHTADILKYLGAPPDKSLIRLYWSKDEIAWYERRFRRILQISDWAVGYQVGAGTLAKEWPSGHTRDFVNRFERKFPDKYVILFGGGEEHLELAALLESHRVLNLVGQTTLRELAWLSKKIKYFVGPDSGPTHLAAACGARTLFIYSGTNSFDAWKPLWQGSKSLRYSVECSPCARIVCPVKGHPCMARLMPGEVIQTLESMLRSLS